MSNRRNMSKDLASIAYGSLSSTETKIFVENATAETLNYSKAKFFEVKQLVDEGNYSWTLGGLISGVIICGLSFLNFFSHLFGLAPLTAVMDVYLFAGGLVCILLEFKERMLTEKYLAMIKREALFLYRPYGRAAFYFFIGILMTCNGGLLGLIGGLFVAAVGAAIFIGSRKAYQALDSLKSQVYDKATVMAKFDQFDKDRSGYLDTAELSALCMSLGSTLSKNELESALFILDKDQDGKITKDEFIAWWQGGDDMMA
jgi:hypothetical protein